MGDIARLKDGSTSEVKRIQAIAWSSTETAVATTAPDTGLMTTAGPGSTSVVAALGSQQGNTSVNVLTATLQSLVVAPTNAKVAQVGIQNIVALATSLAPNNLTLFLQYDSNEATLRSAADPT